MAIDVYYVVKAKFYGNMTHDKGFYYTYYDDVNDPADADEANFTTNTKYFGATFLEPNHARQLFPCFDGKFYKTTKIIIKFMFFGCRSHFQNAI